jgi:hypothetical protein
MRDGYGSGISATALETTKLLRAASEQISPATVISARTK